MCGVIAIKSERANDCDLSLAKSLILESQIRGKHSTGVSYLSTQGLCTIKDAVPASIFIEKHWDIIAKEIQQYGSIKLIAHTRYSTSGDPDITNAQPIYDDQLSLVMNGVITQSSPDKWKQEFGVECRTTNDTEIAHIKMKQGTNPLMLSKGKDDKRFSMAVAQLWSNGRIQFYRNGRRPLYYATLGPFNSFHFVASTKEIISRACGKNGVGVGVMPTTPGSIYELANNGAVVKQHITEINLEDWQEIK